MMDARRHVSRALCLLALALAGCDRGEPADPFAGRWRAVAELPGGELPFHVEIAAGPAGHSARIENGSERVAVERVVVEGERLLLDFPSFNNRIRLVLAAGVLQGTLTLVKRGGTEQVMAVRARRGEAHRFFPPGAAVDVDVSGRWAVTFRNDEGVATPAVGEFRQTGDVVAGTFLTPTGDHRYLAGQVRGTTLHLSTFDGSHAYLYRAELAADGSLAGDFWSGTQWHETWVARRDAAAVLPDPHTLTYLKEGYERVEFAFPDLEGKAVTLDDARFRDKVVVIVLAGSWCPNCHDEAAYLAPLYRARRPQGLEIVALMYEHFGDFATAARQTQRMRAKFGIEYTTLVAGISAKDEAAGTLPMLNAVLAFPTTIFLDRRQRVRAIHTGFAGPGTGEHYVQLTREFEALVTTLLAEQE